MEKEWEGITSYTGSTWNPMLMEKKKYGKRLVAMMADFLVFLVWLLLVPFLCMAIVS